MKIGFIKHNFADKPRWEGCLRDDAGAVVWCCGHKHDCRQGAARKCAREELHRRRRHWHGRMQTAQQIVAEFVSDSRRPDSVNASMGPHCKSCAEKRIKEDQAK